MIENSVSKLSVSKLSVSSQCYLLGISRSCYYYKHSGESELNQHLMRLIDEQFMMTPCFGSRQMSDHLKRYGYNVSRKRVRRLMRNMGISLVQQKSVELATVKHNGLRLLCRSTRGCS